MRTGLLITAALVFIIASTSVSYGCECAETTENESENTEIAVCSECGSGNVVPIVYGKPSQELIDKADRGEVKLGGCVISEESPYNYCKDCEAEW